MSESQRQTNRLQALAESAHLFAEASTDLERLLGVVAGGSFGVFQRLHSDAEFQGERR